MLKTTSSAPTPACPSWGEDGERAGWAAARRWLLQRGAAVRAAAAPQAAHGDVNLTLLCSPRCSVMLVGWGGNNGTTVTGGILANKQ